MPICRMSFRSRRMKSFGEHRRHPLNSEHRSHPLAQPWLISVLIRLCLLPFSALLPPPPLPVISTKLRKTTTTNSPSCIVTSQRHRPSKAADWKTPVHKGKGAWDLSGSSLGLDQNLKSVHDARRETIVMNQYLGHRRLRWRITGIRSQPHQERESLQAIVPCGGWSCTLRTELCGSSAGSSRLSAVSCSLLPGESHSAPLVSLQIRESLKSSTPPEKGYSAHVTRKKLKPKVVPSIAERCDSLSNEPDCFLRKNCQGINPHCSLSTQSKKRM